MTFMCHASVIEFFIEEVKMDEFKDKCVLEVGSKYVNGSIRPLIERFACPKKYVGVDIEAGKYVDIVLDSENLLDHFGPESFDVVISTELLEHVGDWRLVVSNMKKVLKPAGYIYITTRSFGFPYHAYPYDFWRFETDDMKSIFSDFEIIRLAEDHEAPGIFLKCRKPYEWKPNSLDGISLYSMILGRRTTDTPKLTGMPLTRKIRFAMIKFGRQALKFVTTSLILRRV